MMMHINARQMATMDTVTATPTTYEDVVVAGDIVVFVADDRLK